MKKALAVLSAMAILAICVIAGEVYDRSSAGYINTSGTGTFTNAVADANIKLARIEVTYMNYATDTVTVKRVTGDTKATTNTVLTIVCSGNTGGSNVLETVAGAPCYMKAGDKLVFTSGMGSNGYYYVEYIQMRH